MRVFYSVAAIAAMTAALTACGEQTDPSETGSAETSASSSPTSPEATTPVWTGEVIPDGTYTKTATIADAKALGLPKDVATEFLGQDGEFHVELKIVGENYAQFGDDGDAPMTQGDGGTAAYDADGNWVTTSDSTGCPGCVATWEWSHKGDGLTLRLLDTTEVADPVELLVARLVMEGEYTRR